MYLIIIIQACTIYGPRAKCGPRRLLFWPAHPNVLFFDLACLTETPFKRAKTYHFWPLNIAKRNFWPAKRFELCTPDLNQCFSNFVQNYFTLYFFVIKRCAKSQIKRHPNDKKGPRNNCDLRKNGLGSLL